jgi:hypothetical protein
MTTITAEQLERTAVVYVRQFTAFQVSNNLESGRRQYGLVERARQLGWILVGRAAALPDQGSRNC